MPERPERPLDGLHPARGRPQEHAREAEDAQDRHHVEQQDVLDHVDHEELLGEPVDRRDSATSTTSSPARNSARRPCPAPRRSASPPFRTCRQRAR